MVSLPLLTQKTILSGRGKINFGSSVKLGYLPSPYASTGEFYLEARDVGAVINIASNVSINNNAVIISDNGEISIGENTLIGPNFTCFDSDFHPVNPQHRLSCRKVSSKAISIGKNVFIGANVTVLKGSIIGDNSVIGAGCIISGSIPPDSLVSCASSNTISKLNY